MTQTISKNGYAAHNLDMRLINPKEVVKPENTCIDEVEVTKIIDTLKNKGSLPDIIITSENELVEGANSLEASIRYGQERILAKIKPGKIKLGKKSDIDENLKLISVDLLYVHPLNSTVYGEHENLQKLRESIEASGWVEPLLVTPDGNRYRIVSGNSRYKVCLEIGIKKVWAEVKEFESENAELRAFLSGNVGREKSIEQKVREAWLWEEIEAEEARDRQGKKGQGEGTVRDIVAKRVGFGNGVTYQQASRAVREKDALRNAAPGTPEYHKKQELERILSGSKGVNAAVKLVTPPKPKKETLKKWTPKILDRVEVIGGQYKGKAGTVRVLLSLVALVHFDDAPEEERKQVEFRHLKLLEEGAKREPTSVLEEQAQKQQELGLGKGREQVLPSIPINTGMQPEERFPASYTAVPLSEIAIALTRLSPQQLAEVFHNCDAYLSDEHITALWNALAHRLATAHVA
jgi:hypothetical protein